MSISRKEKVRCGWCYKSANLGDWNDLTYSKCYNREMKRAFIALTDVKAFSRKADTYYMCPNCGEWSRGSQLSIIETTDEKLKKLGNEYVIKLKK